MKEVTKMTCNCVVCDGEVRLPEGAMEGELLTCSDCGTDLEILSLNPVTVGEAPAVQEDWGE